MTTLWLKKVTPQAGPPMAAHVDHQTLLEQLAEKRAMGINTPALAYLWAMTPPQELDEWGMPLPLSSMQQDAMDRLVAVLASPFERGTSLLHSGQLAPDETDALIAAFPDLYGVMVGRARADMIAAKPPFPAWAEAQLGIFFRRPAATVYATPESKPATPEPRQLKNPEGTQADRRELAIRR